VRRELPHGTSALGNIDLLQKRTLALFCSSRCPGVLILRTYDFVRGLRDPSLTVIGGFHSPTEKESLTLLLRMRQPLVICPARGIERMRLPAGWRDPIEQGRLLVVSSFRGGQRRPTADAAHLRNQFVAALADEVLVAHAAPGGRTEAFSKELIDRGKSVVTFESPHNAELIALGARVIG
jgi:predicted Rossmann fold nucleotide-binding protein DprA/Smf involved in DNA uptake